MKRQIRFVGGPFGGKVIDAGSLYGRNDIVYRGPKKMTRKQQYEAMRDSQNFYQGVYGYAKPQVEARYQLAIRPHGVGENYIMAPCQHPDGSLFYEYVEGSKREL